MEKILKILNDIQPRCRYVLGGMCATFMGLLSFAILFYALSEHTDIVILRYLALILLGLSILAFAVGVFSTLPNKAAPRAFEGLVAGAISGAVAAALGGAGYYAVYGQHCPDSSAAVKFMRLLIACPTTGMPLGWFLGMVLPNHRARDPGVALPATAPPEPDPPDPKRVFWLTAAFILIVVVVVFDVLAYNGLDGVSYAGPQQENIIFWQYLLIVGSFSTSFVLLTVDRYGWGIRPSERTRRRSIAVSSSATTLAVAAVTGLVLWWMIGAVDMGVRAADLPLDQRQCAESSWQASSMPQALARILVLFVWMWVTVYLGFSRIIWSASPLSRATGGRHP